MGIFDSLFGNGRKNQALDSTQELEQIKQIATRELQKVQDAKEELACLNIEKARLTEQIIELGKELTLRGEILELQREKESLKSQIIELDEKVLLQSFALYQPIYAFANIYEYKTALTSVREQQKKMLQNGTAATGARDWTVNGSAAKGRKMVSDTQKLLLRAFNSECEYVTWKVRYNNFDSCRQRIEASYNAIQKLGTTMSIEISREYFDLKMQELHLALEYQQAKEKEREYQRELRERQREEIALRKELEESRRKAEKEQAHYRNALVAAERQLETVKAADRDELLAKIEELKTRLSEVEENLADLDYRESNQKAGYVYVISNVGSFGEDVYKIGMTRRLEPQERIDELSGASVPFKFDVHAMIFTEDAPKLEASLHHAFEAQKLNLVNTRREFFRVKLSEIEKVVRANYDKSVEFTQEADAEQYRESERIRQQRGG